MTGLPKDFAKRIGEEDEAYVRRLRRQRDEAWFENVRLRDQLEEKHGLAVVETDHMDYFCGDCGVDLGTVNRDDEVESYKFCPYCGVALSGEVVPL